MSLDCYLKGNDDCLNSAVEECLPVTSHVVNTFVHTFPDSKYLQEDLQSEAYLHLFKILPMMRGHVSDPYAYLWKAMLRELQSSYIQLSGTPMSKRTLNRLLELGENVPTLRPFHEFFEPASTPEPTDLRMTIYDCCHSVEEREVVRLREQGLEIVDIAEQMGVPTRYVKQCLQDVQQRVYREIKS